jgi:dTDP-4-dehydrorhamnose 3,5-epimerase
MFKKKYFRGKMLKDLICIEHEPFKDLRGQIWTTYTTEFNNDIPEMPQFVHDKFVMSTRGVLRGIHYDEKTYKLVTCVDGQVQQVVVDMRPNSSTFKKWESFNLSSKVPLSILIPPMFGNAFLVKSTSAVYHYKLAYTGDYADAGDQKTVKWDDNNIGIKWDMIPINLSERDM